MKGRKKGLQPKMSEKEGQGGSSTNVLTSVNSAEHVKNISESIMWIPKVGNDQIGLLLRAGHLM